MSALPKIRVWIVRSIVSAAAAFTVPGAVFELDRGDADPARACILLTNTSQAAARFMITVNGKLSVNLEQLITQIRSFPEAYPNEPDYRKVWRYVSSNRYHSAPITPRYWQHNPSFLLNSIGFNLCDDSASMLAVIWGSLGYTTRVWGLSGHVVSEILIDGRWQMYDADEELYYYRTKDHDIAGVEDIVADPSLVSNAIDPFSPCSWGYGVGCARIYATTNDNVIATASYTASNYYTKDLVFEVPAQSTLKLGGVHSDKALFLSGDAGNSSRASIYSHAVLTIPAGTSAAIDIPLALHLIRGDSGDSVVIGGNTYAVGSKVLEEYINSRTINGPAGDSAQPRPITISGNKRPIEILSLINGRMTALAERNTVVISGPDAEHIVPSVMRLDPVYRSFAWDLDTAGSTAPDRGPHGADGIIKGCTTADGIVGKALAFDGVSNIVDLSAVNMDLFYYNNGEFTFGVWINVDEVTNRVTIFANYALNIDMAPSGNGVQLRRSMYTNGYNPSEIMSCMMPSPINGWHHIVYTYKKVGALCDSVLYIDGVSNAGRRGNPVSEYYTHTGPYLGAYSGRYFFRGLMDEVTLIGRALAPDEVARLYKNKRE